MKSQNNKKFKACLHLHVKGDPCDNIKYTGKEAILRAKELGFQVLAFTCHKKVVCTKQDIEFGKANGILVIPSIEAEIEGKELIILNVDKKVENIKTFEELREYRLKNLNTFTIAPHPFYLVPACLKNKIKKIPDLVDGIEWSYFYSKAFNPNKKAARLAKKLNKPIIGTSDVHNLDHFDHTYTIIHATELSTEAIIDSLKNNRIDLHTKSFSFIKLFHLLWILYKSVK
jgi:predicted metal-dependent phosphoesterase TrpH